MCEKTRKKKQTLMKDDNDALISETQSLKKTRKKNTFPKVKP